MPKQQVDIDVKVLRSLLKDQLSEPDEWTRLEQGTLDEQAKKVDIHGKVQNLKERKKYAQWIFAMVCVWLLIVLLFVFIAGVKHVPFTGRDFSLSDAVIITLITTTTGNITAFFFVVTKHLFPSNA